ncbi:MAG TPA: Mbeg1-like protein, partial [Legionellaceae bacterium]|nr:Mbeg1-like protein [Legionellaceae bacterium]
MPTIIYDNRPNYYSYSLFALHAYDVEISMTQTFEDLPNWQIVELVENGGFRGMIWVSEQNHQYIVAYRGTDNLSGLMEDIHGIVLSRVSHQKEQAFLMVQKAVRLAKTKGYSLGFTGHSLGAFLAELSVFFCQNDFEFPNVHAVTFESPGSLDALEKLAPGILTSQPLDIVQFLSYPNPINTFCRSVGTLYQVTPQL